jgi:hypothetical protein
MTRTRYPILFARRELIEGNGFVAGVTVHGRLLLTREEGESLVEGVNPGGIAARGDTPSDALAEFGSELRLVLFDIAEEAGSFAEFEAEVERFFHGTSGIAAEEWEAAVAEVRAGRVAADWLRKQPAETPVSIQVVAIEQPKAANNEQDEAALAA